MKQFRLILILWLCMAMNAKANETTANLLQQGDSCLSRYDVFHATQYYQKYLEDNPLNYYNAAQMFIASKNKLKAKLYLQLFLANANRLEDKKEAAQLISKAKEQLKQ